MEMQKNENKAMRDFAQSLPMALLLAREAVMNHFRPNLRAHDLTEQQWRVLRVLRETAPLEVTRLAQMTYILSPSLSRILTTLENKNLIKRRVKESDQRRSSIEMTKKGLKLFEVVAEESERIYSKIETAIGTEHLAKLQKALSHVNEVLRIDTR